MCNRGLKQTAISSCEAEFHAASAFSGELLGLAELFKELHFKVSVRFEDRFTFGTSLSPEERKGTRWTQAHRNSLLGRTTVDQRTAFVGWTREHAKQHSRSLHEVSGWTTNAVDLKEAWSSRHWSVSILSFNS